MKYRDFGFENNTDIKPNLDVKSELIEDESYYEEPEFSQEGDLEYVPPLKKKKKKKYKYPKTKVSHYFTE